MISTQSKPVSQNAGHRNGLYTLAAVALVFVISLGASLWYNIFDGHQLATLLFDSRHYLESCRQLVFCFQELIRHKSLDLASVVAGRDAWFSEYIMLDGPVLPASVAWVFTVLNKVPSQTDWKVFVGVGATIQAISSVLVFLLARRLTESRKWGLAAGLLWAFYAPAIVASGRYLTEIPAAALLLSLCFFLSRLVDDEEISRLRITFWSLLAGAVTALLVLLKPVMIPAEVLAWAFALVMLAGKANICRALIVALLSLVFVFLPWVSLAGVSTGKLNILPQRVPAYNLAKGFDIEADGWAIQPEPPVTALINGSTSPLSQAVALARQHPSETLNLFLRKVPRLFAYPWNDFRSTVYGLSADGQMWWHWLICLLALFGAAACLWEASVMKERESQRRLLVGITAVAMILAHLVYIPFEAIVRYGISAFPFATILAVYFIWTISRKQKIKEASLLLLPQALALLAGLKWNYIPILVAICGNARLSIWLYCLLELALAFWLVIALGMLLHSTLPEKKMPIVLRVAFALCLLFLSAISFAFARDARDFREWVGHFHNGDKVLRQINHPLNLTNLQSAFVIVDGNAAMRRARVKVNGQELLEPVEPLLELFPARYHLQFMRRTYASLMGKTTDEMRQWWLVPVPASYLSPSGSNLIEIDARGGSPLSVFGDYELSDPAHHPYLAWDGFAPGRICNAGGELDSRVQSPLFINASSSQSWRQVKGIKDQADLSDSMGRQTGQYRIFLALAYKEPGKEDDISGHNDTYSSFVERLKASNFDKLLSANVNGESTLCINKDIARSTKGTCATIDIPQNIQTGNYLHVAISGMIESPRRGAKVSILPVLVGGSAQPFIMVLPHTPSQLPSGANWQPFQIEDDVPRSLIRGGLKQISIGLYPGRWDEVSEYGFDRAFGQAFFKDLKVTVTGETKPIFTEGVVSIF